MNFSSLRRKSVWVCLCTSTQKLCHNCFGNKSQTFEWEQEFIIKDTFKPKAGNPLVFRASRMRDSETVQRLLSLFTQVFPSSCGYLPLSSLLLPPFFSSLSLSPFFCQNEFLCILGPQGEPETSHSFHILPEPPNTHTELSFFLPPVLCPDPEKHLT